MRRARGAFQSAGRFFGTWTRFLTFSVFPSLDRDKDSLTDEKTADSLPSLIDYLSDKGFDLIGHTNSVEEKVANGALDEGRRRFISSFFPSLLPIGHFLIIYIMSCSSYSHVTEEAIGWEHQPIRGFSS